MVNTINATCIKTQNPKCVTSFNAKKGNFLPQIVLSNCEEVPASIAPEPVHGFLSVALNNAEKPKSHSSQIESEIYRNTMMQPSDHTSAARE